MTSYDTWDNPSDTWDNSSDTWDAGAPSPPPPPPPLPPGPTLPVIAAATLELYAALTPAIVNYGAGQSP